MIPLPKIDYKKFNAFNAIVGGWEMTSWRLGLDLGTNSIGWAALSLAKPKEDPDKLSLCAATSLLSAGVRIFSDGRNPKDRQSLAVARRLPRQQRKRRDRYLLRRSEFMRKLIAHGLMPSEEVARKALEKIDPWTLRVRGLDEKLPLHEFGRALFHLQQRRGFKSNRKQDKGDDDESGKIKSAAQSVREGMSKQGVRTLGEFLAGPRVKNPAAQHDHHVRARLKGSGAKAGYDFYPTRDLIEAEFNALWTVQMGFDGKALSDEARLDLLDTLLFQRPLKSQPVGKCTLEPDEERAPRALPSVQRIRIYQEINNLTIRLPGEKARKLNLEERDRLVVRALGTAKLTFDGARKVLKLPREARFNLESGKRKHLDGDKTAAVLAAAKCWGPAWRGLPLDVAEAVVERLIKEENEESLIAFLQEEHGLSETAALAVSNARLPEGHGNLGRQATEKVLSALTANVVAYDQAVRASGYLSHSDLDFDGEVFDRKLPYYGRVLERHVAFGSGEPADIEEKRYGKIANPTVHVALNQVRRVVNTLMERHGPPSEIIVETARDLPLSAKRKSDLDRTHRENKEANDERRKELGRLGQADTYENRMRLRLWEELNPEDPLGRRCPYSGEQIGIKKLFTDEVEIDHILPFSKTLDDSAANKTVSLRRSNRIKEARTPYEAFSDSPEDYDWNTIKDLAANLPNNKSWRFGPDAMDRYDNLERDFLARHLNDTRYISRLVGEYLRRTGADVWVTPGHLTSSLRWAWGLDSVLMDHNRSEAADPAKNRNDHRHHAIDAVVIGLTDRWLLQHVATVAGQAEERFDKRYLANIEDPWPHFRETVSNAITAAVISHKPDHAVQGALHNDTAYGIVEGEDNHGRFQVVHRKPLDSMNKAAELDGIRDPVIRKHLKAETNGLTGKDFTKALVGAGEAMSPSVRKVRILETLGVIPIPNGTEAPYKAYKGDANYCYDLSADAKGKWKGTVVSRFDANRKGFDAKARKRPDGSPLIMRIRGNDMLAVEDSGDRRIMRVVKFSKGQIALAEHYEGGALKARDADKDDPFKYLIVSPSRLRNLKARPIYVDPTGRIFDPGPPE